MTDLSATASTTAGRGKRERLIDAARRLFHEQGVEKTTIADIAQAADVPVGNVYYYFKTKDDLIGAAIAAHHTDIVGMLASFDRHHTPKGRLKAFLRALAGQRETAARYGCPHGTLCSELDKRSDGLAPSPVELLQPTIDWAEAQFRAMGRRDARDLAVALIAAYQGISLISNTFRDPALMQREVQRLERWVDRLA